MAVNKFTGPNISGIREIAYVLKGNVESVSDPDANNAVDVLLLSGDFDDIYFTPNTADFKVNLKEDEGGIYYEIKLKFKIPKTRSEVIKLLDGFIESEMLFKVVDQNNLPWLIGTPEQPAIIRFDQSIPWQSLNSIQVQVTVPESDVVAYELNSVTDGAGDFNDDYNDDFYI